ncbi:hypothetical protein L596_002628 [Steinernema carpocapsae]|uniref:Uncharacterized protein n=1 Tax=Steinernema carpocapsae TaxID=34508 RepID=A0A4U8UPW8_STECR|nr:hypothetical protein L596_002628 [Steinernema carpocapsae]
MQVIGLKKQFREPWPWNFFNDFFAYRPSFSCAARTFSSINRTTGTFCSDDRGTLRSLVLNSWSKTYLKRVQNEPERCDA